jgi:hypothetical protein
MPTNVAACQVKAKGRSFRALEGGTPDAVYRQSLFSEKAAMYLQKREGFGN